MAFKTINGYRNARSPEVAQAVKVFEARTGKKVISARKHQGSMRGYVTMTIDGMKDFEFYGPNAQRDINGVPIQYFSRAFNNPDTVHLDISWSVLK
jgi:hypothetical protein